jgi:glycerol-3-phosphate dehydrogenase subunit B
MKKEIVVIGGGFAGITACIKLSELGYTPILITKGAGASFMFSGSYDISSKINSKYLNKSELSLKEQIYYLKKENINHPFNKITDIETTLKEGFSLLNRKLDLGLSDLNLNAKNHLLITQSGYIKESALIDKDFLDMTIDTMLSSGENYGILNFTLFKNFFYEEIFHNLNEIKKEKGSESNFFIVNFDFLKRFSDVNLKTYDLARILEKDDLYKRIIDDIYDIISKENLKGVITPAVWGIDKQEEIKKYMKNRIKFIETVSLTPSIAGIRFMKKVKNYLNKNKINVINEEVVSFDYENKIIKSITTNKGRNINVEAIVLATGKFIGGGITIDKNLYRESIFSLPLFYNGKPLTEFSEDELFNDDYFLKHNIYSVGVKTNNRLQPLNYNEKIVFNNLFIAGNVLADYNYIENEGGVGVAVATGYKAAKSLSLIV